VQILGLISQKGGAGKSTLAVNLAAEGAAQGWRTLLLDLDPQANAARWSDRRGLRPPDVASEQPGRLEAALERARSEGYELTIIDTAPHADQAGLRAARESTQILVPCRPAIFDLEAVEATMELSEIARRPAQVVLNAAQTRSKVAEEARERLERRGWQVCPVVIHRRVAFEHSLIGGDVAAEYEPGGPAAQEVTELFAALGLPTREHAHRFTRAHVGKGE
jgi:chromosome partitioning protein